MYISSLSIKNYRNFGDEEFTIPLKPFTAIIGENNIGKSNLLESIGLILSQDITMFKKRMLDIEDINYKTKETFKKQVANLVFMDDLKGIEEKIKFPEVKVEIVLDDMDDDQLAVVGDWFFEPTFTKAKLTYLFRPRPGFKKSDWINQQKEKLAKLHKERHIESKKLYEYVDFPIEQYEYIIYGGDNPANKCDPYFLRMLKLEVLDALRDAKRELKANGEYKLLYRILNKDYDTDFVGIRTLLENLNEEIKQNEKLQQIKRELTHYLDRVSLVNSVEQNNIDFNFSSPEISEILKKLSLIYGQEPISIERNGLGKNNLLFISLVLSHLASQTENKSPLIFRVIGIEEPEAHLHPHSQKHLAHNLSDISKVETLDSDEGIRKNGESGIKKDTQIIVTSHSTHITTSIDLENLVVLYKDKGKLDYHYILDGFKDNREGREHIRYLKKYIDATNSSMFFARKLILVEGISEQILIPTFFKLLYGQTLERIGCNIINVNGLAFKPFLEVIKNGYFIKCGVVTDKDKGTHMENRADELKKKYDGDIIKIEFNEETFEKEILKFNQKGKGKDILLKVFQKLRPKLFIDFSPNWDSEINIDEYFGKIKEAKSDFAFFLQEELQENHDGFEIPEYIKRILKFIMEENDGEKQEN
jgi:putative ATP-dependent endonuclease of the OLD family